ncbi:MAG: hypothetical protein R3C05_07210 [Pirellulaceae bacterium]
MTKYPADLEAIVRRVIADVLAGSVTTTDNATSQLCLDDRRVITLADVEGKLAGKRELIAADNAVITPATVDLLRASSVSIVRVQKTCRMKQNTSANQSILISDVNNEDRGVAFSKQLQLRTGKVALGAAMTDASIVLADLPQPVVCDLCRSGRDAVQVAAIADVKAIAAVMQPKVWVLDMKRLNLIAAVNVALNTLK